MYSFDEAVSLFCLAHGVTYTRYADDLAFSTNEPKTLDIVGEYVAGLCAKSRDLKLKLNTAKTVNVSNKFRRELTGIILANDGRTTLGREKRRMIRAMVDYFARGKLSDDEVTYLRGLIAYARSIDQTIINLVRKRLTNEQMSKLI